MEKRNKYDCINGADCWISAMEKQARGANALKMEYSTKGTIYSTINGDIGFASKGNRERGFIVFPTAIGVWEQSEEMLINKLRQEMMTISDRSDAANPIGWAIGRYLKGKYKAKNGNIYGADSLSVMVAGISDNALIEMAEDLRNSLMQKAVLVKRLSSELILIINSER